MKTVFGWENCATIFAEPNIVDLIREYWEELSPFKGHIPLAPDFKRMLELERVGYFRVWVARTEAGLLIGFIGWTITPHLAYRTTLFAHDAGHYLTPAYRDKGWIGVKMWATSLAALKKLGVKVVDAHDNALRPLTPLFKRLGFEVMSTRFWKIL